MNWLTHAFNQYSIVGLVLSAVIGLLTGAVSSWLTYQFKEKELVKTAELEKKDRIHKEIIKWANPILGAVNDLESRLKNILYHEGYLALDKDCHDLIDPQWSVTNEYFTSSTLYLFAQYFAWVQMLREKLSFELFHSEQTKDEFFKAINTVSYTLSSFPHSSEAGDCTGEDRQVFQLQQRAIGELLILRSSDTPRCMNYPDFLCELEKEGAFRSHLQPLSAFLEGISPERDNDCRWKRLVEMQKTIGKLKEQCQYVLKLT